MIRRVAEEQRQWLVGDAVVLQTSHLSLKAVLSNR